MRNVRPVAPHLNDLVAYDPKYLPARIYLNANESPYGPPARVVKELADTVSKQMFHRYPDPLAKKLRAEIAQMHGVRPKQVLLGNGGDELILNLLLAYGGNDRKLLTAPPSFSSYELDAKLTGTTLVEIARVAKHAEGAGVAPVATNTVEDAGDSSLNMILGVDEQAVVQRVSQGDIDVVMLTSPNNPTGDVLRESFISELLNASDTLVLIDQAYVEFADTSYDVTELLKQHANLVLLRTFSKAYALAGVRLGYLLASEQVIDELCKVRQPYSVDVFSVLAAAAVLNARDEIGLQIQETVSERLRIEKVLASFNTVQVFSSEANFLLFKVRGAHQIWQQLYDVYGILLRDFSRAPYLTDCLRVSIGTPAENDEFIAAISAVL